MRIWVWRNDEKIDGIGSEMVSVVDAGGLDLSSYYYSVEVEIAEVKGIGERKQMWGGYHNMNSTALRSTPRRHSLTLVLSLWFSHPTEKTKKKKIKKGRKYSSPLGSRARTRSSSLNPWTCNFQGVGSIQKHIYIARIYPHRDQPPWGSKQGCKHVIFYLSPKKMFFSSSPFYCPTHIPWSSSSFHSHSPLFSNHSAQHEYMVHR